MIINILYIYTKKKKTCYISDRYIILKLTIAFITTIVVNLLTTISGKIFSKSYCFRYFFGFRSNYLVCLYYNKYIFQSHMCLSFCVQAYN